jgi:hypothetical protein
MALTAQLSPFNDDKNAAALTGIVDLLTANL